MWRFARNLDVKIFLNKAYISIVQTSIFNEFPYRFFYYCYSNCSKY